MKKIGIYLLILPLLFTTAYLYGANVFVTQMDLTSRVDLKAHIETRGDFQLDFNGGYKYQGKLLFQYYNTDLEGNTSPSLIFDGAQASVKDILHSFDLTYFTGFYGILGEGKHYKGHLYHVETGFDYNGYLPVLGTGLIFSSGYYDLLRGEIFIYQRYGSSNVNSMDFVGTLNFKTLTLSLFSGISDNDFRLGTQIAYLGDDIDFYLTMGDPTIRKGEKIDFDDFYFLLEEWYRIKNWNLILSVFSRPKVHYNYLTRDYISTNEVNDIDFNFDLNYEPEASYFSGGTELNIQTNYNENLGLYVSPYISIFSYGLRWKIKVDFNLISESRDFITAYLNINASF